MTLNRENDIAGRRIDFRIWHHILTKDKILTHFVMPWYSDVPSKQIMMLLLLFRFNFLILVVSTICLKTLIAPY